VRGCEGAVLEGLWVGFEWLRSFGRKSCCASSISSCQWQSTDSFEEVTSAGGSQWEHVDRKSTGEEEEGKE
jgi:hypothetical protein